MNHNELNIQERLFSEQNIYLALYSVESYVSNKELLSKKDKTELKKLRDKFDKNNITKWIKRVKERLNELFDKNQYLQAQIYFKPKNTI